MHATYHATYRLECKIAYNNRCNGGENGVVPLHHACFAQVRNARARLDAARATMLITSAISKTSN
eukprot:6202846-Pleurochrysis_carterae.AAC.4